MRQLQLHRCIHAIWVLGMLPLAALLVCGCDLLGPQRGGIGNGASGGHRWRYINPHPTAETLYDIDFADDLNGWAVGAMGTILRSTDGGQTWQSQESGTSKELRRVSAFSPKHAWILSRKRFSDSTNILLHTANGGSSWKTVDPEIDFIIQNLFFHDNVIGFLVGSGGTIARTTDGGLSWEVVHQSDLYNVISVDFINERTGWAIASILERVESNGYWTFNRKSWILKTEDRGNNWSVQALGIDSVSLTHVSFVNENVGWITGDYHNSDLICGILFKTEDGGKSWNLLAETHPNATLSGPYEIKFLDEENGWAAAAGYNTLSRTTDGGLTWSRILVGGFSALGIDFNHSGRAWTVGTRGRIFRSNDEGATWESQFSETLKPNNSLKFFDEKIGIGLLLNSLLTTSDGGEQWAEAPIAFPDMIAKAAFFTDPQTGWVFGKSKSGPVDAATILQTHDGGTTWSVKYKWDIRDYFIDSSQFYDLRDGMFTDALHGWAVGSPGVFLSSSDGGENWTGKHISKNSLQAVKFINNDTGWAIGAAGTVLFTPDGGQTWSEQTTNTNVALLYIDFADAKHGWIVGEKATLLRTNNAGATWTKLETGLHPSYTITDVDFIDMGVGWICGNRFVLKTSDGGLTWNQQFQTSRGDFSTLFFLDKSMGWASGKTLIQTTNGGE